MTEELRESIERIRSLAPDLNKATDEAHAVVARVEKFLDDCSIGVPAQVQFSDEDLEGKLSRQKLLSYGRVDGKFRIAVTTTLCLEEGLSSFGNPEYKWMPDDDNPPVPWGSCPREVKLASFSSLPKLLQKIASEASSISEKADETAEAVRQILDAVNGK